MPTALGSLTQNLPALSNMFQGLGSSAGSFLPQAAEGAATAASSLPSSVPTSLPTSWDPSQPLPTDSGMGAGNTPSPLGMSPGAPSMNADDWAAQMAGAEMGAAGGVPTATPGAAINNPALGANAMAMGGAMSDPSIASASSLDPSQSWGQTLLNWIKSGGSELAGTPGKALSTAGGLAEAINRWVIQRNLQNPANLTAGANALYQPLGKAMRRSIIAPVTAAAQETGQINAPGLYAQSVTSALAPYQYAARMNALREYLASQQAAAGIYPPGGIFGAGGLVPQGTFGGPQAANAG